MNDQERKAMNATNEDHARRIAAEVSKILADLPNPNVQSYEMRKYAAMRQVTERIRLQLGKFEMLEIYIERMVEKAPEVLTEEAGEEHA